MSTRYNIWVVIGTRPEAIKMCPVVRALKSVPEFKVTLCFSGQHPDMVIPVLDLFDEKVDVELSVMQPGQSLSSLSARLLTAFDAAFDKESIDAILVHGDTTTSSMAALCAYYKKIPVAHVEAGLRTDSIYSPWPEEANRRLNGVLTTWHFAPTVSASKDLLAEGKPQDAVWVTGNTVIDALHMALAKLAIEPTNDVLAIEKLLDRYQGVVLVTAHRRENHGDGIQQLCRAIKDLAIDRPELAFVYPVHPNPNVSGPVRQALNGIDNVLLLPPQPYDVFITLMKKSRLIITDSGGIQEEAPALSVPVLVCRDTTERPEAVESGWATLVGMNYDKIVAEAKSVLNGDKASPNTGSPYGDGKSALRIAAQLRESIAGIKTTQE